MTTRAVGTRPNRTPAVLLAAFVLLAVSACTPLAGPRGGGGGGGGGGNGRSLIFDDEFNGTHLDTSKWRPNWLGGSDSTVTKPINGAEQSCYDPRQVSVGGGALVLRADQRSCTANNGVTYGYASGLVETANHFTFTYGHAEARVWLQGTSGGIANWPAFWLDGTGTWPLTGELDVMEGLSGHACYHFHSVLGGPGGCAYGGLGGAGWHVYAADWSPGRVTYSYDGIVVGSITSGITSSPMFLILNLAVGGWGMPTSASSYPARMLVDYVRVWR